MKRIRKGHKLTGALLGAALVLAACGGGSDSASEDTTGGDAAKWATGDTKMTITYDIADNAVWEENSPITWEDFECTALAALKTPGSISTSGVDKITNIEKGDGDKQVKVSFNATYAPWRGLFGCLIKKAAVANCADISQDFQTSIP
ncbi:MAG: hypothetical protein ACKOFX_11850, partial [Solirubrobacterales bacterium]